MIFQGGCRRSAFQRILSPSTIILLGEETHSWLLSSISESILLSSALEENFATFLQANAQVSPRLPQ